MAHFFTHFSQIFYNPNPVSPLNYPQWSDSGSFMFKPAELKQAFLPVGHFLTHNSPTFHHLVIFASKLPLM